MSDPPRFSVVVPTRDRAALMLGCVLSLLAQDHEDYEIVVADDGSTDGTRAAVGRLADAVAVPVHYVRLTGLGANAARNAGRRRATGGWICFVDDDELVPPDHLRRVEQRLRADPGLAALGGPVREVSAPPFRVCDRCSLGSIELPEEERSLPRRLLAGNMVVRRSLFDDVGDFDETLRGIGEESEWFHRLGERRLAYDPELWLWHQKSHLSVASSLRTHYRAGRNIPRYHQRTGGRSRPSLRRGLRSLAHVVRRRCWKGVLTAGRELGYAVGHYRLLRSARSSSAR